MSPSTGSHWAPSTAASAHPLTTSGWGQVWRAFKRQRLAYLSLWGVGGLVLMAILAPLLASNQPLLWRVEDGPIRSPWLGSLFDRNLFESELDLVFNAALLPGSLLALPVALAWARTRRVDRSRRKRLRSGFALTAAVGWLLMVTALLATSTSRPKRLYPELQQALEAEGKRVWAVYPPLPYSFRDGALRQVRARSSLEHPLGTDEAGRDVLVRLLFGTRISLSVGLLAVLLYVGVGTVLGAVAGYRGGRADAIVLRLIEVVSSIPTLFLVLALAAFVDNRSVFHIMGIIAAVGWTTPARLTRAEFLRLRELDFVLAARASGFGDKHIIFRQILPNALGPVLVAATFGIASCILIEASMSFLGLGDLSAPSWGQVLSSGRNTGSWSMILGPGLAIFFTVTLLNLCGDGLRDALDPRLRR